MAKRITLIAALLMVASPAFAAVTINIVDEGGGVAAITYNNGADAVRAYALDITVDGGAVITGVSDFFATGEGAGYGIFPGRFRDFINPATPNWADPNYTPIAPAGDPGALGGIGTAGVTIELGSLYVGTAPPASGTLCKLTVDIGTCMTVALNTTRGGVVLEDATAASVTLPPACVTITVGEPPLAPQLLYGTYDSDCNIPVRWGPSADATSYDVERSLNGGAFANVYSGAAMYVMNSTNSTTGTVQYRARANNAYGSSDWTTGPSCTVILSTCYRGGNTADPNWAGWVAMGRPDCWCIAGATQPRGSGYQCDGDADGTKSSAGYRVYTGDATMMSNNWKKRTSTGTAIATNVAADPNTTTLSNGNKIHGACADFDHKQSSAGYRIYTADATVLSTNWKKKDSTATSSALPGNCPR